METVEPDAVALCHALFDAMEHGDIGAIGRLTTAETLVWHSYDNTVAYMANFLPGMAAVKQVMAHQRFAERRYEPIGVGALLRHRLQGVLIEDGQNIDAPIMVRAAVVDRHIIRLDEYVDSAALAPLAAALGRYRASLKTGGSP